MSTAQLSPTQQLQKRYTIVELVGSGGIGEVYRARDSRLQRDVAIKVIPPGMLSSEERRERIRQEALAVSKVDHPSVAMVFDYISEEGQDYLISEFVSGDTLSDVLHQRKLLEKEVLEIATQLAEGLAACHARGVVHGDIKPGNLRLTPDHRVKILDFGLAASAAGLSFDSNAVTVESIERLGGTIPYMAPEQLQGHRPDTRSDLFSAGCVLYELVTSHAPFGGPSLAAILEAVLHGTPSELDSLHPGLSPQLRAIILRCLEKDPELRYQTAADLLADLRRAVFATPEERSLAVLYFENTSQERDDEYFRDGITEDVITELSKIRDLRVFSRSAVFGYRDKPVTPGYVGQQLKARYVLEGSLRRDHDRLRINATLTDTRSGHTLWAERYDRKLEDLFAVQDDIATSIARQLRIALTALENRCIGKVPTANIAAYDSYLRGRHFFLQFRRTGLNFALEMFQRAIEQDPRFAGAYAGMANCHSLMYMYWDSDPNHIAEADHASGLALDLDPELAETRVARGLTASLKKDYEAAQRQFEEAIRLNPTLFEPYYFSARNAYSNGRFEEAIWWFEQASRVDPDDYQALMLRASALAGLGRRSDAEAVYRAGMLAAEHHLEAHPFDARALYFGANALSQLGDRERARKWAGRATELEPEEPMVLYNVACVFALMGESDAAMDSLERSVTTGWAQRQWMEHDPDLASLRDHPRFKALVQSAPPAGQKS